MLDLGFKLGNALFQSCSCVGMQTFGEEVGFELVVGEGELIREGEGALAAGAVRGMIGRQEGRMIKRGALED